MKKEFTLLDRSRLLRESGEVTHAGYGPVFYWMTRDMRLHDNWSLVQAMHIAKEQQTGVCIGYNLHADYLGGNRHQLQFKLTALQEIEEQCKKYSIPFLVTYGKNAHTQLFSFIKKLKPSTVVVDMNPLRIQKEWNAELLKVVPHATVIETDAHNIVPVWIASLKAEVAARTFRPKIYTQLPTYLQEIPKLPKAALVHNKAYWSKHHFLAHKNPWPSISRDIQKMPEPVVLPDGTTQKLDWIQPGEKAAHRALKQFRDTIKGYSVARNEPALNAQSQLSPYLHYGMLSAQRVVLDILSHHRISPEAVFDPKRNGSKAPESKKKITTTSIRDDVRAFLEELVVRRELADNYCFYNPRYDSVRGFSAWAQETLKRHEKDPREYTYTYEQFERAETHEPEWNACQRQMVLTGKMHGYMRMHWAKKILEWSKSPQEALKIAIRLNNRYELDGRDPNGYVGVAWAIGGVHDRPWGERDIFGCIRYMNAAGLKRKFDIAAYCAQWLPAGEEAQAGAPQQGSIF